MLRIERVGVTTVQDVGRRGLAHLGVPTSGAADRASYLLANRLAGNVPGAAMFETSGGLSFTALNDVDVVVAGAKCDAAIGSRPAAHCAPMLLRAGETFNVTRVREGVRAYVAVSGGSSRHTDTWFALPRHLERHRACGTAHGCIIARRGRGVGTKQSRHASTTRSAAVASRVVRAASRPRRFFCGRWHPSRHVPCVGIE